MNILCNTRITEMFIDFSKKKKRFFVFIVFFFFDVSQTFSASMMSNSVRSGFALPQGTSFDRVLHMFHRADEGCQDSVEK